MRDLKYSWWKFIFRPFQQILTGDFLLFHIKFKSTFLLIYSLKALCFHISELCIINGSQAPTPRHLVKLILGCQTATDIPAPWSIFKDVYQKMWAFRFINQPLWIFHRDWLFFPAGLALQKTVVFPQTISLSTTMTGLVLTGVTFPVGVFLQKKWDKRQVKRDWLDKRSKIRKRKCVFNKFCDFNIQSHK